MLESRREVPIVLASGSPRRREILAAAGVPHEVHPPKVDESPLPDEAPEELAERLARGKALSVARKFGPGSPRLVLAADTIVVVEGEVLGKPRDAEDAERLLGRLLGRTHRVITGVAAVETTSGAAESVIVESRVRMRRAAPEEVRAYVASGEPLDKAGAYAAQGLGRRFIERIEGSESNVIGLPLEETLRLLERLGWRGSRR